MKTAKLLIAPALIGIYIAIAFLTVPTLDDRASISDVITKGAAAVTDRDLSALVSLVSRQYSDDLGLNHDRLRLLIARELRNEAPYDLSISKQEIEVDGERAEARMQVVFKHRGGDVFYDRELTFIFARETGRHLLVAPVPVWRVISSENLGLSAGDVAL